MSRTPQPCGTRAAYMRHIRHGEAACHDCRSAHAAYHLGRRRIRAAAPKPKHVHGTTNGYVNYYCRCPECRAAWSVEMKRQSQRAHSSRVAGGAENRSNSASPAPREHA